MMIDQINQYRLLAYIWARISTWVGQADSVLAGIIRTEIMGRLANDPHVATYLYKLRDRHPIGRSGNPDEVVETVKWWLSDAASFVTGAAISVDGGYLAI